MHLFALVPVLVGLLFRKRILRALGHVFALHAAQYVKDQLFVEEEVDVPGKGPTRVLRPSPASLAILQAFAPPVVQTLLESVKLKLPKFAPVNPATGALDFTAGIAAKMAAGKNISIEEIGKSLFMQFGMPFIEQKIAPMLEGLVGKVGVTAANDGTSVAGGK